MSLTALAVSAHLFATAVLVGYYTVLALIIAPAVVTLVGGPRPIEVLAAVERRAMPLLIVPRYLAEVAGAPDPVARLAALCLDPHGALFDEPRSILAQELDVPHTYFSLLSVLASGPKSWGDLSSRSKVDSDRLGRYRFYRPLGSPPARPTHRSWPPSVRSLDRTIPGAARMTLVRGLRWWR